MQKQRRKIEEMVTATALAINFPASRPLRFETPENLPSDPTTRPLPLLSEKRIKTRSNHENNTEIATGHRDLN